MASIATAVFAPLGLIWLAFEINKEIKIRTFNQLLCSDLPYVNCIELAEKGITVYREKKFEMDGDIILSNRSDWTPTWKKVTILTTAIFGTLALVGAQLTAVAMLAALI